jgi:hypothetical protein
MVVQRVLHKLSKLSVGGAERSLVVIPISEAALEIAD